MSKTTNPNYHELAIKAVEPETEKAVTVTFDIPSELQKDFAVIPGQYIKLKTTIADVEEERFYSICNYSDNTIQVGIKRVENGTFSNYACDHLRSNNILSVQAPQGDYSLPDTNEIANTKRYCFIAAGSGITPNLAMIRYLLTQTKHIEVNLIYVNTRRSETMFFDEIEGLKNTYMGRFSVTNLMTREPSAISILSKRPNTEAAGKIVDQFVGAKGIDHIYLCGPMPLIELFRNALIERGIEKKYIHMELFGTPTTPARKVSNTSNKENLKDITIISQGVKQKIKIRPDQNILDAALESGITVPFACKGGVCATCKAQCLDGTDEMVLNYGLEDDEVERGMVLTCQTFVTSETGTYDFDVQ